MDRHHDIFPEWMNASMQWKFFGPILHAAQTYAEYEMLCSIHGYLNPDSHRRHSKKLPLECRYEPYEEFIFQEATSFRGHGLMNEKARTFRDEIIKKDIEHKDRDINGVSIPSRYEILHSQEIFDWCIVHHPEFLKLRRIPYDKKQI